MYFVNKRNLIRTNTWFINLI